MKIARDIVTGWACLLLAAGIVSSSGSPTNEEIDEFDNSVAGIIGDGLHLTNNSQRDSSPAPDYHQLLPHTDQNVIRDTAAIDTGSETTTASVIAVQATTDQRRIFAIRDPLQEILRLKAEMEKAQKTATSPSPPDATTVKVLDTSFTTDLASANTNRSSHWSTIFSNVTTDTVSSIDGQNTSGFGVVLTDTTKATFLAEEVTTDGNTASYRALCGYPPICDQNACRALNSEDRLANCEIPGAKVGFTFMVVFIALAIIVGNSMLPILVWRNRDMRASHNLMKVSLAVADAIIGFVLLFSVIPNMVQTMSSTEMEVSKMIESTRNSPQAIVAGSMLTLSAQASLFHLTYLSIERFVAIRWPLWHRYSAPGSLSLHVVTIWILSIAAALTPAAFPGTFTFTYIPSLFVYIMTAPGSRNVNASTIYLVVTMVLPFLISVILTAVTGVVVWRKMKSTSYMKRYSTRNSRSTQRTSTANGKNASKRQTKSDNEMTPKELKPEVAVFKTTVIMIFAFCITLLPFIVVALLDFTGYYECSTYSVPFASAFYACLLNSFINVLIYTARDRKFRGAWKKILKLSKKQGWATGTWKSQRTKTTTPCASTISMSQRPGQYTPSSETSKERWERALVGTAVEKP